MTDSLSWPVLVEDRRLGGHPEFILTPANRPLMQIPDRIRKCVVFVAYEKPVRDGTERTICGTGFFTGLRVAGAEDRVLYFVVTAKHIIDKAQSAGTGKTYLRINDKSGGFVWVEVTKESWIRHPLDSVDVAVAPIVNHPAIDILFVPEDLYATERVLREQGIGIGDDTFVVGLFKMHPGKARNIPIIRSGNIAAMPEEPVQTKDCGMMDAFLVESRSIGGLSGSPVFVYIDNVRMRGGDLHLGTRPSQLLLGLIHGHWNWPTADIETDGLFAEEKLNVGISIVVPTQRIVEVLESPEIMKYRSDISQAIRAERERNLPVAD